MGDSSLITLLSVVPLLIIVTSIAVAVISWRSRQRAVRTIVAILLMVVGAACILPTVGKLFSIAAGALIGVLGVILLIAEYGPKSAA